MITIISKIELEGTNNLKYTDIGHTEDIEIINQINEDYDLSLGKFLGENKTKIELGTISISEFFDNVPYINEARTQVTEIESLGLIEVTNIKQL